MHPGKEIERRLNIGRPELAARMGITRQYLNMIIIGKRGLSPKICKLLARHLGETPEYWARLNAEWRVNR
jgi:plasmid maintenance system antidote protein VapI